MTQIKSHMITQWKWHIFKGLNLIDRVPKETWMEVCDIVQEAVMKIIPKKNKCKKLKLLSEKTLKVAEKRREAKGRGERERCTHLKSKFQLIAMRNGKPSSVINATK